MSDEITLTGILDISIEQSTSDLTAGEKFNFYVLIRNPLRIPCWIDSVRVGIPSGFELPRVTETSGEHQKSELKTKIEDTELLTKRIGQHELELSKIEAELDAQGELQDSAIALRKRELQSTIAQLHQLSYLRNRGIEISSGGVVNSLQFTGKAATPVSVSSGGVVRELRIRHTDEATEDVDLERPIPKHVPLQPSNVASFTIAVRAKSSLLFSPAQYRLQFNVAYHFGDESALHVTSVSHTVTVRAPTSAVLIGSAVGSVAGVSARYFASPSQFSDYGSLAVKALLAVILGLVAVVFMSRKSEKQSFISVEDFWGGMVIGFLVAYSGAEAISDVMNITQKVSPKN
nr:hypothetical protein [uncultured Albidiferax sp.]